MTVRRARFDFAGLLGHRSGDPPPDAGDPPPDAGDPPPDAAPGPDPCLPRTQPVGTPATIVAEKGDPRSRWMAIADDAAEAAAPAAPAAPAEPARWLPGGGEPSPQAAGGGEVLAGKLLTAAVGAYCAELCPASEASAASAEVLGSFGGGERNDLLRAMRVIAAGHAAVDDEQPGGWRRVLAGERDRECASTPARLAARANGELLGSERPALELHLKSCVRCQALELRALRAERAFAGIIGTGTPGAAAATAAAGSAVAAGAGAVVAGAGAVVAGAGAVVAGAEPPATAATSWLPPELSAAASDAGESALPQPVVQSPVNGRSRRRLVGLAAATGAVVAAMTTAAILLTGGSSGSHRTAAPLAATHAAVPAATPVYHKAPRGVSRPHRRAAAAHHAQHTPPPAAAAPASAPVSTPTVAAGTAAPQTREPVPSTPVTSSPAPSAPSGSPSAPQPAPSPPAASFQQPSLGAANASQGIGSAR